MATAQDRGLEPAGERLLSIEDLCQRWSVTDRYLRDLRDKRIFPGIKLFARKHVRYAAYASTERRAAVHSD